MTSISVRWVKEKISLQVDLSQNVASLKAQLYSLTHVLPDKQKLMWKGKVLQEDSILSDLQIRENSMLMMMGSPEQLQEPVEQIRFVEDLSQAEIAQMYLEKTGTPLPAGLVNLGNTCYANSVIQCLRRIPELRQALVNFHTRNQNDLEDQFTGDFANMIRGLDASTEPYTPLQFILRLRQTFERFNERSEHGGYKQQDSEEFFSAMMDVMSRSLIVVDENGQNQSLVDNLFQIEFSTVLSNVENPEEELQYGFESNKRISCVIDNQGNPIDHLIDGIKVSLNGSLEKYSDTLGRNAVYNKTIQISRLPNYLVVQFIRFIYKQDNSAAGTRATKAKILRAVNFPHVLDVYDLCTEELQQRLTIGREMESEMHDRQLEQQRTRNNKPIDAEFGTGFDTGEYQLIGVVTHKGRDADGGHYVSWVHMKEDEWVQNDDDVVKAATKEEILQLKGGGDWHIAYLCFYRKLQVIPDDQ